MKEDWRSQADHDIDLQLEDLSLELEEALRDGAAAVAEESPEDVANADITHALGSEDPDEHVVREVRSVFPAGYEFPDPAGMSREQLRAKLCDTEDILADENIIIDLCPDVPERLRYEYIVNEVLDKRDIFDGGVPGFFLVFDGCHGSCRGCFQEPFCHQQE
jgi:hypothetical protein